jgi:hypothetical protein
MPKATAVWLVENTVLTFDQIGDFCGLHALEVQGIADGEVAVGIVGLDPVANGQLTQAELDRCIADPQARLTLAETGVPRPRTRAKGARYTPLSKRQDRPDAISWMIRIHPEVTDAQVVKLLGTTKNTINAVRDRTHWNINNIKPHDPVSLGICTQAELDEAVTTAQAKLRAREEREEKARAKAERAAAREAAATEAEGEAAAEGEGATPEAEPAAEPATAPEAIEPAAAPTVEETTEDVPLAPPSGAATDESEPAPVAPEEEQSTPEAAQSAAEALFTTGAAPAEEDESDETSEPASQS